VFLPGLAEITDMKDALEKRLKVKGGAGMLIRGLVVVVHVLHSLVPQEEQEAALEVSVI
jgi:HrpA-like RNA helicase